MIIHIGHFANSLSILTIHVHDVCYTSIKVYNFLGDLLQKMEIPQHIFFFC